MRDESGGVYGHGLHLHHLGVENEGVYDTGCRYPLDCNLRQMVGSGFERRQDYVTSEVVPRRALAAFAYGFQSIDLPVADDDQGVAEGLGIVLHAQLRPFGDILQGEAVTQLVCDQYRIPLLQRLEERALNLLQALCPGGERREKHRDKRSYGQFSHFRLKNSIRRLT